MLVLYPLLMTVLLGLPRLAYRFWKDSRLDFYERSSRKRVLVLGAERAGEMLVREPSMALGYARPEDNEDAYDEEGYFRMGDLGRLVDGDHIVCTGRKKDLIIRAGENISAREIEDVLFSSSLIEEVAVVSMPSKRTGEAICAFIVPAAGASVDLADVTAMVSAAGLARQKTPEHLVLVEDLPKTPSGKLRRAHALTLVGG